MLSTLNKSSIILLLSFLNGNVFVNGATVLEVNRYIDGILHLAMPNEIYTGRLDPLTLPRFTDSGVDKQVGMMSVHVHSNYNSGNLTGLSQGHRVGDCSNVYYQYGNVTFNCSVVYGTLKANYQALIKYGVLGERRSQVTVNFTNPLLTLEVTSARGSGVALLRRTQLVTLGRMSFDLSGLGPINNRIENVLRYNITRIVPTDVTTAFYGPYASGLANAIRRTILPNYLWF